jgi:hypothetical protein
MPPGLVGWLQLVGLALDAAWAGGRLQLWTSALTHCMLQQHGVRQPPTLLCANRPPCCCLQAHW